MFTGYNAYLGGANPPNQQQYGQQQSYVPGEIGVPQQLQSQFTGYPVQNPQVVTQPSQQSQFQAGQQNMPPPPPQQRPQPTGMTSSQLADSFRSLNSKPQPSLPQNTGGAKIPNIRLSFITAQDQAKFEQLFKSATGNQQALSGEQARDLLLRSKLSGDALSQIWYASADEHGDKC